MRDALLGQDEAFRFYLNCSRKPLENCKQRSEYTTFPLILSPLHSVHRASANAISGCTELKRRSEEEHNLLGMVLQDKQIQASFREIVRLVNRRGKKHNRQDTVTDTQTLAFPSHRLATIQPT